MPPLIALRTSSLSVAPSRLMSRHATLVGTAVLTHFCLGHVDLALAARLLIGSVHSVLLGGQITLWVPRRALQVGLAGLPMTSAARLLQ
jgi:uncharacterized membrane protein YfcA